MDKGIIKRLKKGWHLTKGQLEYVQVFISPQHCNECGTCRFNLMNFYGLIDGIKAIPTGAAHGKK